MMEMVKRNKLLLTIMLIYLILAIGNRELAWTALGNSTYYLIEMAQILPVIFMLTVAIDLLIPKEWIIKRLGSKAGLGGALLAVVFGSVSAGPIYAAFPIVKMLHKKGASVSNVVIILSSWAVIKVPMLANEAKFLGPQFMLTRWILTLILIISMGWLMERSGIRISEEKSEAPKGLEVNKDYCIGCGLCNRKAPQIFAFKGDKAYLVNEDIDLKQLNETTKESIKVLADQCPSKAIMFNLDYMV